MKIPIINDSHFGVRMNAEYMLEFQNKFFKNVFFPYLKDNNVKTVINLGDIFDDRKKIDINTLNESRAFFFDPLRRMGVKMLVTPGNHDCYFKNTNNTNSLVTLLNEYDNITILEEPDDYTFGSTKFKFIPWINQENYQKCLDTINREDADVLCGHFEIAGFKMNGGNDCVHGMHQSYFPKSYKYILSGHFHSKSEKDNIYYLGAQYEMTWIDVDEVKGFHVFDTETKTLEFIQNPYKLYEKVYFNDSVDPDTFDFESYKDKIIRLYVVEKNDEDKYNNFIEKFNLVSFIDFKIIEDYSQFAPAQNTTQYVDTQTTKDLIFDYIDNVNSNLLDKERLKGIMNEIYVEALNVGEYI